MHEFIDPVLGLFSRKLGLYIRAPERSLPEKIRICAHVGEKTADERRQMDDVGGLVLLKYGQGLALAKKGRDARRSIFFSSTKTIFQVEVDLRLYWCQIDIL